MIKITDETIRAFDDTYKVALTSTIDDEGEPHITLINTLKTNGETELTSGEFITGLSKEFMQQRKNVGFFVMSLDKNWWNGTAIWKSKQTSGKQYEEYNQIPMFRYNSYVGIHTIHYYDLVSISQKRKLNLAGIMLNAIINLATKFVFRKKPEKALSTWAYRLMRGLATLKFISFIGDDGFPKIVPVVQASACSRGRIVVPMHPYFSELSSLKTGTKVALMGMTLGMENAMVKGTFTRMKHCKYGYIDIERVYNSMPPKHGYV